jgi:hypothetical protein
MSAEEAPIGLKALIFALMDKNLTREEVEAYLSQRKYLEVSPEGKRLYPFGVDVYAWITKEAAYWNLEMISHRCFYRERKP